jgi:hypothetical protein
MGESKYENSIVKCEYKKGSTGEEIFTMCGEEQQFFFGMSLLFRLEFRYM